MMDYEYAVRHLIGTREEQQDEYVIERKGDCLLAVVCDGMGGSAHGKDAALYAAQMLRLRFLEENTNSIPHFFLRHIESVSETVYRIHHVPGTYSGTTLAACILQKDQIYWLSVGDSRIYLKNIAGIRQLTVDHNYARQLERQLKNGEITREKYAAEQKRGQALTSFIGQRKLNEICMNVQPLPWGDTEEVILMSDGLYKVLTDDEIASCTMPTAEATAQRIEKAIASKRCSSLDNTTFIIIKRRNI